MEAPEKIYLITNENGTRYYTAGKPFEREYIEYTRIDAFIEKACEWLKDCLDNGAWIANDVGCAEKDVIIEYFQNYMKENNHGTVR